MIWIVTSVIGHYITLGQFKLDINCEAFNIHYDEFYNTIS